MEIEVEEFVRTKTGCIDDVEDNKNLFDDKTINEGAILYIPVKDIEKNYVSKQLIRDKINECRSILYSMEKEYEMKLSYVDRNSINTLLAQISILKGLLGE